jgi:hypothetical protein
MARRNACEAVLRCNVVQWQWGRFGGQGVEKAASVRFSVVAVHVCLHRMYADRETENCPHDSWRA